MAKQEIYRSVKVTDNVKTSTLSVIDQIRLIISKAARDDQQELIVSERLSVDSLTKISALMDFFENAVKAMNEKKASSVTMKVSSEFLPFIDEVAGGRCELCKFYNFEVIKKDVPIRVKHFFIVKISKKE